MFNLFGVFSKAAKPSAPTAAGRPRNWRCQLGTFWQDIEELGSVLKARQLRDAELPIDPPRRTLQDLAVRPENRKSER
jgi:hypothetical protein